MKKVENFFLATLTIALTMLLLFIATKVYVARTRAGRELLNPIVRLVGPTGHTFCSGVVIDSTTIVTAGHCVIVDTPFGMFLNPDPIEIRAADNIPRGTFGKIKVAIQQLDRGVLKGDFSMFAPRKYISDVAESIKTRKEGAEYLSCGYPLGGDFYCSKTTYLHDEGFAIAVKGVLIPGMSGGPTMLSDGTVIAINVAVAQDYSIVSPIYNVDMMK